MRAQNLIPRVYLNNCLIILGKKMLIPIPNNYNNYNIIEYSHELPKTRYRYLPTYNYWYIIMK